MFVTFFPGNKDANPRFWLVIFWETKKAFKFRGVFPSHLYLGVLTRYYQDDITVF